MAFIQASSYTSVTSQSNLQITLSVTAGNMIIVTVQCNATAIRTFTVSDNQGNTYFTAIAAQDGGPDGGIYYAMAGTTASTTITVTANAAVSFGAIAYEFSEVSLLDKVAQFNDTVASDIHYHVPPGGIDIAAQSAVVCMARLGSTVTSIAGSSGYTTTYSSTMSLAQYRVTESALLAERAQFTSVGTDRTCFGFMASFIGSGGGPEPEEPPIVTSLF